MKIRLVYSKLLFHHIVEHLLSFQGRISHTFHQAAYLKSMFLAMLHIFADNQQSCVTNMIAVGMYRTNRLVEQFAGGTFGHIPFSSSEDGRQSGNHKSARTPVRRQSSERILAGAYGKCWKRFIQVSSAISIFRMFSTQISAISG